MNDNSTNNNIQSMVQQSQKYGLLSSNLFYHMKVINQSKSLNLSPSSPSRSLQCKIMSSLQPTEKSSGIDQLRTVQSSQKTLKSLKMNNKNLECLPKQLLDSYSVLQSLELENNRLRIFPKEIFELDQLQILNLNSNYIKLIPEQIFNKLPKLETFKMCNNLLNNISASINKWQGHLIELDISFNRITHLKNLYQLLELRILRIESNEFRLLPFSMQRLENLYEFGLDWYKYISPPQEAIQHDVTDFIRFLKQAELDQQNDTTVISDDELNDCDEGVTLNHFILYFSTETLDFKEAMKKAVREQDIGVIISLSKIDNSLIDVQDENNFSLLTRCLLEEKYFSSKSLIELGANVNKGKTPQGGILNLALLKGQIHVFNDLITHKGDPHIRDANGNCALHYCMVLFDKDIEVYKKCFELIMTFGGIPNQKNNDGWAPIHLAVKKGTIQSCLDGIKMILQYNKSYKDREQFNINAKGGRKRQTPLHLACQNGHIEILLLLLSQPQISLFEVNIDNEWAHRLCFHSYKLHKLIQSFEKREKLKFLSKLICYQNYNKQIEDDNNSSIQDEIILPYEMEESIFLSNNNSYQVCNSLWSDIIFTSQKAIGGLSQKGKPLNSSPERIIQYISHLQQFYSRAKFESFKEDSKIMDKLYYLTIILKSLVEIKTLTKEFKRKKIQFSILTIKHIIFCMIQLLQKIYELNQNEEIQISQPGIEGRLLSKPKQTSKVNHFFPNEKMVRANRFIESQTFCSRKSLGIQLSIQLPKIENSQECPESPTISNGSNGNWDNDSNDAHSYQSQQISFRGKLINRSQKKSQQNIQSVEVSQIVLIIKIFQFIYWQEFLIKTQQQMKISNEQVKLIEKMVGQKNSILAYEAYQSFFKLKK